MEQQLLLDLDGAEHKNGIYTLQQGQPSDVVVEAIRNAQPPYDEPALGSNI